MPKLLCYQCRTMTNVQKNEIKLLDKDGDFVCCVGCLIAWIKSHKYTSYKTLERYPDNCCKAEDNNHNFRSVFEASIAEVFLNHNLSFYYEPFTFYWFGKQYTPDFYFPDHDCFVEVKGKWNASNRSKYRSFREMFSDVDMVIAHWLLSKEIPKKNVVGSRHEFC